MTAFVLDCSVTMAWWFENQADAYTESVLDASLTHEAHVPAIWPLEVANALLMAERRKQLAAFGSVGFVEQLRSMNITIDIEHPDDRLEAALTKGRLYGLTAYDAAYLELALRLGVPLATKDSALKAACRQSGVPIFMSSE